MDFDDIPPPKNNKRGAPRIGVAVKRKIKLAPKGHHAKQRAQTKAIKAKLAPVQKIISKSGDKIITQEEINNSGWFIKKEIEETADIIFQPNAGPQTEFLAAIETEVLYGGARGGGKSYSLIADPLRYCPNGNFSGLLLRRTMGELRDLIEHTRRLYLRAFPGAKFKEQEKEWRFPSGARLRFGYCENKSDVLQYQGQAYQWIGIDEIGQFPDETIYHDLKGSLRSVDPSLPTYMRFTANPGGPGAHWLKRMFIDPAPPGQRFTVDIDMPDGTKSSFHRRYIPARLSDNPYLTRTPSYLQMLASLPEVKRKQWLDGDWDAFEGAAFPEFDKRVHVIKPFTISSNWPKFRACDYGYGSFACCLWFAVGPDNELFVYRELYTHLVDAPAFADLIRKAEHAANERIMYGILDSSLWAKRGDWGPSLAEQLSGQGVRWKPADRSPGSRVAGKLEIHRRLKVSDHVVRNGEVYPNTGLYIFDNCPNLIRTLPVLPVDDTNPEDVNTKSEDHAYDALRYGCMSRPLSPFDYEWGLKRNSQERYRPADSTFGY